MRKMKDSGIEWIGKIPNDWRIVKVKSGMNRVKEKANQTDPVILSLTSKGVVIRDISNNEGQIAASYYEYNPVKKGDLLLNPMDLVTNAFSAISEFEGVISPAYFNLQCNSEYNNKYYDYYFKLQYWALTFFAHGKGVSFENRWTLNAETLMNYPIPHPSFSTQQCIADFLDKKCADIDHAIELEQTGIELLKESRQSIITEAVTKGLDPDLPMKDSGIEWIGEMPQDWEVVPLTKFLESIVDYRGKTPTKLSEGVFLITARNVKNGIINYDLSQEYVDNNDYSEIMRRGLPEIGDVLFTTEAPLGEVANIDRTDIALAQRIIKFRGLKEKLNNYYLKYWIMSSGFQGFLQSLATGSTAEGIKASKLSKLILNLPSLNEQQRIADYLDQKTAQIDLQIQKKQNIVDKLQEYKKSLIFEAVTGKIEV